MRSARPSPRARIILSLAIPALLLAPGSVLAVSDGGSCPDESSGFIRVSYEQWWLNTVEFGFGGDIDAAVEFVAELLGIPPTEEAARQAVIDGVIAFDANGNGFVCQKRLPATSGHPSYVFNGVDDSRSKG